jgi:hypothetical protein
MKRKAFTLVEISLYLALAALICTGILYFLMAVSQAKAKSVAIDEVQVVERLIYSELNGLILAAQSINWSASVLDEQLGSLVVIDRNGQATTLTVDNDGVLTVGQNASERALNLPEIRVTEWRLVKVDDETVELSLELAYLDGIAPLGYAASWTRVFKLSN